MLAAWTVLENLAVSLDQIGGVFGHAEGSGHDPKRQRALQEALAMYLTRTLVQAINDARIRLGQYIPDEEAEALSEATLATGTMQLNPKILVTQHKYLRSEDPKSGAMSLDRRQAFT